ncbi:MAG: hypothetical protein ACNS62_11380 [Candidatus Cyclobacteriaceae bacterium M3_2C_046]
MEKEMIKQDTFLTVKDVIESQFLKKLRMSNIYKAFKLGIKSNKQVKITYSTDTVEEKSVVTSVQEIDEYNVGILDSQFIPIRAIKEIKF